MIYLYVDDKLIFCNGLNEVEKIKVFFSRNFDPKDLGQASIKNLKS